jgi:NAD(P)-dependent dehydrogenase (short-subunit alcohol dehydrogenase family)/acyl dehydratase
VNGNALQREGLSKFMEQLCITPSDMALFSAVSQDVNPLHMSSDYARRTAFGEPVVFGILGALATLQHTPPRPGQALSKVSLLFLEPLFVGVRYHVAISSDATQDTIDVFDGRRRMVESTFTYQDVTDRAAGDLPQVEATASRTLPAEWDEAIPTGSASVGGAYMPPAPEMERFIAEWQLRDKGITPAQIAALAWTSYVVGMEIPGKQAAYSRLEMSLAVEQPATSAPYSYTVELVRMDPRFNLLQLAAQLRVGQTVLADAKIAAFLRSDSRACSIDALESRLPPSRKLDGRVALVIGGSRGLGAALVAALASQGCTVLLNYSRSQREAETLRNCLTEMTGEVRLLAGDAADHDWCHQQSDRIVEEFGGLDFLVCNASPAIRPLDFTPETVGRLHQFVDQSLRLVTVPLAAFLEPLRLRGGRPVVISSIYARTAPGDFPHYVAVKSAIEGLMRSLFTRGVAAHGMVVRPPKLLTDQTNTPMGKKGAVMPEQIAAKVVSLLLDEPAQRDLQVVEDFEIAAK